MARESDNFLDLNYLIQVIALKQGDRGLRETAEESGVSASTLSRIKNGQVPDIGSLLMLSDWLGIPTENFFRRKHDFTRVAQRPSLLMELVTRGMPASEAELLCKMLKATYSI